MSHSVFRDKDMKLHHYLFLLFCFCSVPVSADLANDEFGKVEVLPDNYPEHWFFAHDVSFFHMLDAKSVLLNANGKDITQQMKGMFNSSFMAAFVESATRPEIYIAETYYTKGHRGERRDTVVVFDKKNLSAIAEIPLEPGKRAGVMPSRYTMQLVDNDRYLLIYNFTPATSITVVDVVERKVLNEISLPSCALAYPTGKRGFSALCSDASMITYQFDENGKVTANSRIESFFDIDKDALFERPAIINGMAYFPTFTGNVREINLKKDAAKLGKQWSLVSEAERKDNWRPGGMQLSGSDENGRFYILMHRDGKEGSHKNPGSQVWVFNAKKRKRVQVIELKTPVLAIELTYDKNPLLLTTNVEMNVDVYRAKDGQYLRTMDHFGQETPLILHAVK